MFGIVDETYVLDASGNPSPALIAASMSVHATCKQWLPCAGAETSFDPDVDDGLSDQERHKDEMFVDPIDERSVTCASSTASSTGISTASCTGGPPSAPG